MQNKELLDYCDYIKCREPFPEIAATKIKKKYSQFHCDILSLVNSTQLILEKKKPMISADIWQERKIEMDILKMSLGYAQDSHDDTFLLIDCFFINKHARKGWPFSRYNEFVECLAEILSNLKVNQIHFNTLTTINYVSNLFEHANTTICKDLIRKTKLDYKLELEQGALKSIDEALDRVSGNEILFELVLKVKEKIYKELEDVEQFYKHKMKEIETAHQKSQQEFSKLLEKYNAAIQTFEKDAYTQELDESDQLTDEAESYTKSPLGHDFIKSKESLAKFRESSEEDSDKSSEDEGFEDNKLKGLPYFTLKF